MSERNLISVVVPVYNEQPNITTFYDALMAAMADANVDLEIIFVDDGSTDESFRLISDLRDNDRRVKAIRFSRNFGSHPALTAGLRRANGDAAVMISVDLQDPPELIHAFLERWRQGYHVVWGVRTTRDDPWMKKMLAGLFYSLLRRIALPDYPSQGMDCCLLDRRVVDVANKLEEIHRILPPMLVWIGFRQTEIPYHRSARHAGKGKWTFGKRVKAAIDILVSFSYFPIRFISYSGMLISLVSFIYGIILITRRLVFGLGGVGWPSIMVAVLFLGGVQLIMLGIIGEYIWRTSEEVRERPLFIVMDEMGFDDMERIGAKEELG